VRQVIFTDVLIVGRLDVDGQSYAPIGLHKTDCLAQPKKNGATWQTPASSALLPLLEPVAAHAVALVLSKP
jgi:hypothetical protein